jgi:hypothetical protein
MILRGYADTLYITTHSNTAYYEPHTAHGSLGFDGFSEGAILCSLNLLYNYKAIK